MTRICATVRRACTLRPMQQGRAPLPSIGFAGVAHCPVCRKVMRSGEEPHSHARTANEPSPATFKFALEQGAADYSELGAYVVRLSNALERSGHFTGPLDALTCRELGRIPGVGPKSVVALLHGIRGTGLRLGCGCPEGCIAVSPIRGRFRGGRFRLERGGEKIGEGETLPSALRALADALERG